jgi:hypothetical protein
VLDAANRDWQTADVRCVMCEAKKMCVRTHFITIVVLYGYRYTCSTRRPGTACTQFKFKKCMGDTI